MIPSTAALLLLLTACASLGRGNDEEGNEAPPEPLTLCVQNETVAHGNIIARAALVRFDVMPGSEVCKRVLASGPAIGLQASTPGGGLAGRQSYSARLDTGGSRCWRWTLTDSPASAVDLMPCALSEPDGDADADATAPDSAGAMAR
jgi:hypothetical protein